MKSFQFKSLLLLAALIISLPSFGQGLKAFKLKNGLSVYIWEDESKSDVFGLVGVRAGSINDPEITNHVLWPTELKRHCFLFSGCKGKNIF